MGLLKRGFTLALTWGVLSLTGTRATTTRVIPARGTTPQGQYSPQAKEHYLSTDDFGYVRPGFHIQVNSVTIPSDNRPIVDLTFTDDLDQPLDRAGKVTPGALTVSLVLAWYDAGARQYTAYTTRVQTSPITNVTATQAAADAGGTFTDLELGHATYKFRTALPAGYDRTKTHTVAIYATRATTAIVGKNYFANVEYDFRPDSQPVTQKWDEIPQAACNRCHNPLSAHGGSRQDVKLCVTCHNPQTTDPDTGNTVDFKVMIHKIHDASNLPSVKAGTPYVIIGNAQSVNDFSTVVFPQDVRNCTTCHAAPAAEAMAFATAPSRAACASCHDNIDWGTGANHPAGAMTDDTLCQRCHVPQSGQEWDASILGAHTVPFKSTQLKGLKTKVVSVTNSGPGQKPTVMFQITNGDGTPVDPASLGTNLALLLGGPTADYAIDPIREAANRAAFDGTTATYTFTGAIPANATGTWAVSIEARRTVTLNPAPKAGPATVTEGAFNPVFYTAVTDAAPVARRKAVDIAKCNTCHDQLSLHGGQRFNTEECVMCHNPNASDKARRPADQLPVESIAFKRMIHRIHTGEDLSQDFTVYGFGGSKNTFNEVRFPGDRRDCQTCHLPGTYTVPDNPPAGRLATATPRDWFTPQLANTAACLGCHDTQAAAAHAYVNTAPFGEACAACHGNNAEFSVDKVHAR
jgi:OmcA/MtrC family decaheme c-type cytochrome